MSETHLFIVQQTGTSAPTAREQLREQIRNTVADAQRAAEEGANEAASKSGSHVRRVITTDGNGVHVTEITTPPPVTPGTFTLQPSDIAPAIKSGVTDIAYGFFLMCAVMVVGWPLARAFGRRIENKPALAQLPPATSEQLARIEQAVEAMSIEVERISEAQRYMAKIQSGSTAERV